MQSLEGRVALVTGSTRGLGLAIGKGLGAAGARVVLHGLERADEAVAAVADAGEGAANGVHYMSADLSDPAAINAMIAAVEKDVGPIDIVINNAVVRHFSPVETFPRARWDEALAVNLTAPFHIIQKTLPHMRRQNWGRIVNMSSGYGFFADADRIDYVTTKTALLGLTRAVALETARSGITCNAICPGSVLTPAIQGRVDALAEREGLDEAQAIERYLEDRQPSRRFVRPEDVAQMILFICGPAGRDMSGAAIPIDGAWLAS
ncbi:MAG: SDR family NAD(P)-dependent oxidoreductase [Hyphomicrobiaceae bacterium]